MLATLAGFLALLLGLLLLLLPLLLTELSRPRDSAWGAVVLLLGLVLVTSAERLTGAPMLAVLCGGLLVGRLGGEVAQGRWRALSDEERQALRSSERWSRSLNQLAAVVASFVQSSLALLAAVSVWLAERRQSRSHGKRWVRTESAAPSATAGPTEAPAPPPEAVSTEATAPQAAAAAGEEAAPPPSESSTPVANQAPGSNPGREPESTGVRDGAIGATDLEVAQPEPGGGAPIEIESAPGELEAPPPSDQADQRALASEFTPPSSEAGAGVPQDAAPVDPGVRIVSDFNGVDAILAAASEPGEQRPASSASPQVSDPAPSSWPAPEV